MRPAAVFPILLLLAPFPAAADDPAHESLAPLGDVERLALDATPLARIHTIRAPLLARPAFTAPGLSFESELAIPAGGAVEALWLARGDTTCALQATALGAGPSRAWPDLPTLQVERFRLDVAADCAPAFYALHVRYQTTAGETEERQESAVRVMDPARHAALASGAAQPRIVVLADPQIGDPRGVVQAAQEDPASLTRVLDGTLGDGGRSVNGTWKAVRTALAEAKALDPDFVLIAGDLGFGQLVPASYAAEYEEIWRVLAAADVPMFVAPGNHDGYIAGGVDGFAYWRSYIGPTYTLAPAVPGTYVLVMNTYDWSDMDRLAVSYGISAWGGQVRAEQLAWIADALAGLPEGERVISVSHHSPAWRQDPFDPALSGVPVAEQVERGAIMYATLDQGWAGENRLPVRDLLREHGVEVAFAGHTHHDRIARDDGEGGIVGTTQTTIGMPEGFDPRMLHRWSRDDIILHGETQDALADALRAGTGPLYVDTTTAMSETEQYWGYRPVAFAYGEDGALDLARFGYPLTQEELDALALHPERYNVAHAELGLFSTPLLLEIGEPWSTLG